MARPTGVTILAVLDIIGGVLLIVSPVFFLGVIEASIGSLFGSVISIILVPLGIFSIAVGWGFWTGKGWSWIIGLILYIIGLAGGIISITGGMSDIFGVLINLWIIYYLTRPRVKRWFGR